MSATATNYTPTATWLHLHALRLETLRRAIDDEAASAWNLAWSPMRPPEDRTVKPVNARCQHAPIVVTL